MPSDGRFTYKANVATSSKKASPRAKKTTKKKAKKKVTKKTSKRATKKKVAKKKPTKKVSKKTTTKKKVGKKKTTKKVGKKKATKKKVGKKKTTKKVSKKKTTKKVSKKKTTKKKVGKKKTAKKKTTKKVSKKKTTKKKVSKKKTTKKKVSKKKTTKKKVGKKKTTKKVSKKKTSKKDKAATTQDIAGETVALEVPQGQLNLPTVPEERGDAVDLLHLVRLYARFGPEGIDGSIGEVLAELERVADPSWVDRLFATLEDDDPFGIYWQLLYVLESFDDAYLRGLLNAFPALFTRAPQWACTCLIRVLNTRGDDDDCAGTFDKLAAHASTPTQQALSLALQLLRAEQQAGWTQEQLDSMQATLEVLDADTLPLFPEDDAEA